MANRPVFFPTDSDPRLVEVRNIEFTWFPGMATSRKQLCIDSLHEAVRAASPGTPVLEISSKSRTQEGLALSAFNQGFPHPRATSPITVECAFQGSKAFEHGGPFHELYGDDSRAAKKFFADRHLGRITGFNFFGQPWPAVPRTLFYNWIYLQSLHKNRSLAEAVTAYSAFTDIEFNPERSINCQAHAAALYVALHRRGELDALLKDRAAFTARLATQPEWMTGTAYEKHHPPADELALH